MVDVRNKSLPQRLVEIVGTFEERTGEADCIKLLLCKSAPFVWGMQRAISERIDGTDEEELDEENQQKTNRIDAFFKYLPEVREFRQHGDSCEDRYTECKVIND